MKVEKISKNIRIFAKANTLTLEQVAVKSGIMLGTLKYKLKHHNWTVQDLYDLAQVFEVNINDIINLKLGRELK
jgi:transcriptional regulator with XRE-family HTH domain